MTARAVDEHYDPDLVGLTGEQLERARARRCVCGHRRSAHHAATGALGSFGGSACELCWECPTFRPVEQGTST